MASTSHLLRLLQTFLCLGLVQGHGRMIDPPSRSSMWRFGFKTPINYNDNQLFCGGFGIQYSKEVGGKCGVCGDPWKGPRENEAGGLYATGTIGRKYIVGQIIDVSVDLTANHKGYFEFRLCQKDDPKEKATWDCMNKHLLTVSDTGKTRFPIAYVQYGSRFDVKLSLPQNVKCKACVLQWKYNAGNRWGTGKNGTLCIGCGNQEQFYGCADIAIGHFEITVGTREPIDACAYGKMKDHEWQWDCSGTDVVQRSSRYFHIGGYNTWRQRPYGSSTSDSPFLIMYFISLSLVIMHNMLVCC